uniref:Putative secreted protein n=1 Tax=Anopheles darlingi TaxID=43151 RepID=A0A2M4DK31_ANODA
MPTLALAVLAGPGPSLQATCAIPVQSFARSVFAGAALRLIRSLHDHCWPVRRLGQGVAEAVAPPLVLH